MTYSSLTREGVKLGNPQNFDVVVIGGGPAGSAVSLALIRRGFSVAILERTQYDGARIGETLPPGVVRPLIRLGIWEQFLRENHLPTQGTVTLWGDDEPFANDFIFNPYGPGWHIDRARFDLMLANAALAAGVVVYRGARLEAHERSSGCGSADRIRGGHERWRLRVRRHDDGLFVLKAHWVIDASGRATCFARRLGIRRRQTDRLVAVIGFGRSAQKNDSYTAIEACADGWVYAAPLPSGRTVASFFTDADLLPRGPVARQKVWNDRLRESCLASIVAGNTTNERLRVVQVVSASSAKIERAGGEGWLAIGDAAQSYDPLSGQGIAKALTSALDAADTVGASFAGDSAALDQFVTKADLQFERYLAQHRAYYKCEGRWPHSLFWQRRKQLRSI